LRPGQLSLPTREDPVFRKLPEFALRFIRTTTAAPRPEDGAAATEQVWDELGLLLREVADGTVRRWTDDASGNVRRYQDRERGAGTYQYTSWTLLSRQADPLGQAVHYRYTAGERLAAVVDPGGTVHEYIHDHKERLTQVRRHGVVKEEYRYDLA